MALPVIKAKSYNYGSYANPQQVKFRKGIGAQIGDQFGAGLAQGMQEKRAEKKREKKEIKKFNENVDEWQVRTEVAGLKELGADATEQARKQFSLAIDALRPERGDTVDDKVKKELALEKLFTDVRVMKKTQELDFDAKGKNLASSSQADFINGANAADGLYGMNFNKETLEMEFSILEIDPYSGSAIPNMSMKRIDPTSFLDKVSNLNTKYDSLELTDKLELNDVTKAPKILQNLYNNKREQFAPLTRDVVQPDGSKDIYFNESLVKNYLNSEDPNSQMGKFINGAVEVKGQTIWEDTLGKKGFDKNNPDHIAEVKDVVAGDIAKKYSEYRIGSIKPAPIDEPTSTEIKQGNVNNDAKKFIEEFKKSVENNDLERFFKNKEFDGSRILQFDKTAPVTEGEAKNPLKIRLDFEKGSGYETSPTIDLTNEIDFNNLVDQMFGNSTYDQNLKRAIKKLNPRFKIKKREDLLRLPK